MGNEVRPALDGSWDAREQQLSMLFCRAPGATQWVLINQGKVFSPNVEAEEKEFKRIGDAKVKVNYGPAKATATVTMYVDNDLVELAEVLGQPKISAWAGTEEIRLDPTKVRDFMVINYDGTTPGVSKAKTVEYLNAFKPGKLGMALDADANDARVAEIEGAAADFYMMPVAGA